MNVMLRTVGTYSEAIIIWKNSYWSRSWSYDKFFSIPQTLQSEWSASWADRVYNSELN
jgi:hypothetical protein